METANKSIIQEIINSKLIRVLFIVTLLVTTFRVFVLPFRVDGGSMLPTLNDGQIGIALKTTASSNIKRGDIVIIQKDGKRIIKRVIALPHETIAMLNNALYVQETPVNNLNRNISTICVESNRIQEDYLPQGTITDDIYQEDLKGYYVLGDNRTNSKDSRYYGPFSQEEILGVVIFVTTPTMLITVAFIMPILFFIYSIIKKREKHTEYNKLDKM